MAEALTIKLGNEDPYRELCNDNGYVREHRYLMAKSLGRLLVFGEVVHHLNGVRTDNRLVNLVLTTRGKHEHYTLLKTMQKRIRELEQQSPSWSNIPDKPRQSVKVVV